MRISSIKVIRNTDPVSEQLYEMKPNPFITFREHNRKSLFDHATEEI